ncbi:MAG: globin domain-containing protein [Lysobacterales bacterium]
MGSETERRRLRASLDRVVDDPAFLTHFYDAFLAISPEIGEVFRNTDMPGLRHKLHATLRMLILTADDEPGVSDYLHFLGRTHARLHIRAEHFVLWRNALIDTLAQFDPGFDARLQSSWTRLIDDAVAAMQAGLPGRAA